MEAFVKVFQVAALLLHSLGLCDGACLYTNSWESAWWSGYSQYNVYYNTYQGAVEFSTYRQKSDTNASLIDRYVCVESETASPYTYYVRQKEDDSEAEECVKVHVSQHAQLMLHASIKTSVLFSCNFGAASPGITCGLMQGSANAFSWQLVSDDDAYDGSYYLTATAAKSVPEGFARIYTPALRYVGEVCVKLAIRVFLNLSIQNSLAVSVVNMTGDAVRDSHVWFVEGGFAVDTWKTAMLDIPLVSEQERIEIAVFRVGDTDLNMAIDKLQIQRGKCPIDLELYRCNFGDAGMQGTACDMIQDDTDQGDWKFEKAETASPQTGPSAGYGGSGHYIYMESSPPLAIDDKLRIHTPALELVGDVCVQFAYHMYGRHTGKLHVYLQHEDDFTTLWSKQDEQGNRWILEHVDVSLTSNADMIGFEAVRGSDFAGDIAVDELVIFTQKCSDMTDAGDKTLEVSECKARSDYPQPMEVLVRYPFDFSIRCPIADGKYQASVKASPVIHSCVSDSFSFLVVRQNTITMQLCIAGRTYEKPFANVELKCVEELSADAIGSTSTKGKAMVLAFGSSDDTLFYTARYLTNSNGTIQMSLQGSTSGKLQPDPAKSYSSVGLSRTEFDVALVLRTVTCNNAYVLCQHGGMCTKVRDGDREFKCICGSDFTGRFCETSLRNGCDSVDCGDNGACKEEEDARCECNAGYTGEDCSKNIDDCQGKDCSSHGACTDLINGYYCVCDEGYSSKDCADDASMSITGYTAPLKEGQELQLTCQMAGNKTPVEFSWFFLSSDSNTPRKVSESQTYSKRNVSQSDAGSYTCIGAKEPLESKVSITVNVVPVVTPLGLGPEAQAAGGDVNSSFIIGVVVTVFVLLVIVVVSVVVYRVHAASREGGYAYEEEEDEDEDEDDVDAASHNTAESAVYGEGEYAYDSNGSAQYVE